MSTASVATKKGPSTRSSFDLNNDVSTLRARIQELEKQVADYKSRLDSLRKAKNNYVVKKEKEYVDCGPKYLDKKSDSFEEIMKVPQQIPLPTVEPCKTCEEEREKSRNLTTLVETLTRELDESKNLSAALKVQNEELKGEYENHKMSYQQELASACFKEETAHKEVKKWEQMYKEWMTMMEQRVATLLRANEMLQRIVDSQSKH